MGFAGIHDGVRKRLHPLFLSMGAKPTYLLSPEIMRDEACVDVFRSIEHESELGTHLHGEYAEPDAFEPDVTSAFPARLPAGCRAAEAHVPHRPLHSRVRSPAALLPRGAVRDRKSVARDPRVARVPRRVERHAAHELGFLRRARAGVRGGADAAVPSRPRGAEARRRREDLGSARHDPKAVLERAARDRQADRSGLAASHARHGGGARARRAGRDRRCAQESAGPARDPERDVPQRGDHAEHEPLRR